MDELLVFIVNGGEGSKIVHLAEETGINGGTVFLGEGTVRKGLLRSLGLDSVKREIILLIGARNKVRETLHYVTEKKQLEKKNKGIGFTVPLNQVLGIHRDGQIKDEEGSESGMFQAISVIVDKGEAQDVMEVAQEAGAQGGTIVQARGAGSYETRKVFQRDIVPEKEILLILSSKETTSSIVESISEELNIEEPNTGVLFVTDLGETRGLI